MPLLDKETLPSWYEEAYTDLAKEGRRVIALAHRSLGPSNVEGKVTRSVRRVLRLRRRSRDLFYGT